MAPNELKWSLKLAQREAKSVIPIFTVNEVQEGFKNINLYTLNICKVKKT